MVLIDEEARADRNAAAYTCISVEGYEEETDARRGKYLRPHNVRDG
jgi:hypothetical protein